MEREIELEQENIIIQSGGGAVNSVNGYTGDVILTTSDLENTSDYQNDTQVQGAIAAAIAGKQDTLTAGDNITITNNVISATDTTYTAGSGIIISNTDEISADTTVLATQQNVADEATARENADINLQGQIDAISAASDVTDIVGTYADLQNYDTQHLKDNDIIKVLQDESQNDETTYYRWSTTTQTFTLIGEEGPYYTKSATDTLLAGKQDKLTAGANITIDAQNEISATDTTYSNFVGTDGVTAGTAGLVPAPATTDVGKFLKADGTWDTAGGSGITELTSADYNWPTSGTATSVALWLLDPGVYLWTEGTAISASTTISVSDYRQAIVGETDSNGYKDITVVGNGTSGSAHVNLMRGVYTQVSDGTSVTNGISALTSSQRSQNTGTSTTFVMSQNAVTNLVNGRIMTNAGAPTTATVGTVGQLLEDTTNGKLYICTDATNPYVWEEVGAGGGGVTELTTADLDYPDNNPTGVALWRLDPGVYSIGSDTFTGVANASGELSSLIGQSIIIVAKYSSASTSIVAFDILSNASWLFRTTTATGAKGTVARISPSVVQTAGTSTTDVMSQNAATSMVFADPATQKRVKIGAISSGSDGSVVIGYGAQGGTSSAADVVIGESAYANNGNRNVVIGSTANTGSNSSHSIAIGASAKVDSSVRGAIALGPGAHATVSGVMDIGASLMTDRGYNSSTYRLLTGLYDPQSAHDAANKEYVDPTTDSSAPTTATVGRLGQIFIDTATSTAYMCVDASNPYVWKQITA